jgi:pyrroline-5-carboxylate reductase
MGRAIARGALTAHVLRPGEIIVAEVDEQKRTGLGELGCSVTADARDAAEGEQVLLAVKPQVFAEVADAVAPVRTPKVVITIMAGIGTDVIRARLGDNVRMIRVMPNTPCQLGEGMTGIALGQGSVSGDEQLARHIFEALGRTAIVDESLMHAVTAVSGSGPAYVYLLAELMEKAATTIGLDEATARLLVVQTIIGAGRMMRETGLEPAELRRVVTTPGGTTAAAVEVMSRRKLPEVLVEALTAARDRGIDLGLNAAV